MKILKRILIGLAVILVILLAWAAVHVLNSGPTYSSRLTFAELDGEVNVLFDEMGVPHIYAQNAPDAYFALGYVHAQDRLFQMEMLRRAAGGRLSEVLGEDLLPVDKLFRTLGINLFAKKHAALFLQEKEADFQAAAHAYQAGINEFIRTGPTPVEFELAGIPKTEFTPEDIYLAVGFMSFGFAEGIRTDPVIEKIKAQLGENYLKDLAVQTPADAERIKNFDGPIKSLSGDPLITALSESLEKIPVPLWSGSNGWAVAGSKTSSGFPILANDTHIGFGQPAVWYEAHLEYPGFRFYGHHLAGVPFGLLGNTPLYGWGLTMFENDDTDFYRETLSTDGTQAMYKGQWENLSIREEIIKVKGQPDVVFPVKSTKHGPLVNGIIENVDSSEPVSLWWLLNHVDNHALQAAHMLNHAGGIDDVSLAASLFSAPGLNLMYADASGNIAWWAAARLPVRPPHVNPKLFLDGGSGKDENQGYYEFSKNPHSVNPPWGFVYSANNQPDSVDGVLYPGYYYPRSRPSRIIELLSRDIQWTVEDMKYVNLDAVSKMHTDIAKVIAAILRAGGNTAHHELAAGLEKWDGDHREKDTGPSIYYNLLSQIMVLAMQDELGYEAYHSIMMTSVFKNSYDLLIRNENSPWWDNIQTAGTKESRQDIVKAAADRTLELLRELAGDNPSDWSWGKFHTLKHKHPLGSVAMLDKFFSVGPMEAPGGIEVINNLHFDLDTTGYFPAKGGPALRKVIDFGDPEHGITVSPTGQSGNVMSPWYDNQAEMYVKGKFRFMLMNDLEITRSSKESIRFLPKK